MSSEIILTKENPHLAETPICQVCGDPVDPSKGYNCPVCNTIHHLDCWEYLGTCSTYGCTGETTLTVIKNAIITTPRRVNLPLITACSVIMLILAPLIGPKNLYLGYFLAGLPVIILTILGLGFLLDKDKEIIRTRRR